MMTPTVKIDYLKVANYAFVHNSIDLCKSLEIRFNKKGETANDIQDVMVVCTGEYLTDYQTPVMSTVSPDRTIRIKNFEIRLDEAKMAVLTERVNTTFTLTIVADATSEESRREVFHQDYPIELMAYDQWLGTTVLPQSLASFVTPDTPSVSRVIVKAAAKLKELSGSSSFTEYQSGNPNEVVRQVAAIYAALHEERIVYRSMSVSYEQIG